MKCHGCGHEFSSTSARCPRCQRSTSRRGRTTNDSRLLEFPRRTRIAPPEAATPPLPAWRVELNEKVRAIRANRGATASTSDATPDEMRKSFDTDATLNRSAVRNDDSRYDKEEIIRANPPSPDSNQPPAPLQTSGRRSSNNIVEAALTRVKRASENASRAALPKIEPARSIQPTQGSLAVDREATARAFAPMPEIEPAIELLPAPKPAPEVSQSTVIVQSAVAVTTPPSFEKTLETPTESIAPGISEEKEKVTPSTIILLEEIEPLDYLEAEVRKVDKALGAEFLKNESPSLVTHAVIGIVDLLAIALSCSPFVAIVMIVDGSFEITQTRLATGALVGFIALFYLALTQYLSGRTFGMMLTNTRVVDSQTFEAPSPLQVLLRTAGYLIAVAPALIGILWAAFDYKHRGWHDYISRTVVVRDF